MTFRFDDCEIDPERHEFRHCGEIRHLEPQVFQLLLLLAENAGEVVSKDAIIERVWHGRIVSDATISARISAARAAVGDTGKDQNIIRTVTRVGLVLVPEVAIDDNRPSRPQLAPLSVRTVASRDGSLIAWTQEGDGPPLIRAGHWLTNLDRDRSSLIWAPWLERLGRGRRLIRYDSRGTGMSDADCGPMALDGYVEDLLAVADAAGAEQFDVFAASQSLAVTCAFAVKYPDRVRRIVSFGGWPQGSAKRGDGEGETMTEALGTMLRLGWGQPEGGYMKAFVSLFIPGANDAQSAALVELQLASATAKRAVEIRQVISQFDVTDILSEVTCPVLVAHARNDNLHHFSQAQLLMRHLPDARLLALDSPNHILLSDEPAFETLMDWVDDFLA